jgi:hypothetical protein
MLQKVGPAQELLLALPTLLTLGRLVEQHVILQVGLLVEGGLA